MKILISIIILLSLCNFNFCYHKQKLYSYTPEDIFNLESVSDKINLIDPFELIKTKEQVLNLVTQIQNYEKIKIFIYIIPRMHNKYYDYYSGRNKLEIFTDQLFDLISKSNQNSENFILITFSISDANCKLMTGSNVRDYLHENILSKFVDSIKVQLSRNFNQALLDLITQIHIFIKNKFRSDMCELIFGIFKIILLISIPILIIFTDLVKLNFSTKCKGSNQNKPILSKIKEISENDDFIKNYCIICLDSLENEICENINNISDLNNCKNKSEIIEEVECGDTGSYYNINYLNTIQEIGDNSSVKENIKKEYNTNINLITKLECGHSFHSKCIHELKDKKNNFCPVCKIEKNILEEKIRNLISFQRELYPEISELNKK